MTHDEALRALDGWQKANTAPGTTAPCEHCGSPEGSAAHFREGDWLCALVPYTKPCPKCDGRGFTRETVDGQRESDKCGWCHGGGVVPGEPKEVEPIEVEPQGTTDGPAWTLRGPGRYLGGEPKEKIS